MINVDTVKVTFPLKKKFAVSKGSALKKTNLLTILNNRYAGEASGSIHYGPNLDEIENDIKKGIDFIKEGRSVDVETLNAICNLDIHPIACSALVTMFLNYISGETRRYPWEIISLGTPVGVKSSITVSLDESSKMIHEIINSEFPVVKVKLGGEDDLTVIEALSNVHDRDIRVDANGAWSCEQAEEMIFRLANAGVTVIEQPTDVEFIKEWPHLRGKNEEVELFFDEGMNSLEDYKSYADLVQGVNIKMEKCGGILKAVEIARVVREDKKKIMLGCMLESSVGIAQSLYMSSMADYWDLDGPLLLEDDIATGINYCMDTIEVDREIIGGPKLKRDVVEKYITE
ncbi:MAG: enolase C-terminal domain-like protein [Candidatus Zixiibacteriota bacterium]